MHPIVDTLNSLIEQDQGKVNMVGSILEKDDLILLKVIVAKEFL
nr:MAG TPA: hypothetical protein [Caudoviricetes sp.]